MCGLLYAPPDKSQLHTEMMFICLIYWCLSCLACCGCLVLLRPPYLQVIRQVQWYFCSMPFVWVTFCSHDCRGPWQAFRLRFVTLGILLDVCPSNLHSSMRILVRNSTFYTLTSRTFDVASSDWTVLETAPPSSQCALYMCKKVTMVISLQQHSDK